MLTLLLSLSSAHATDVMFVGNSYVLWNDLPTVVSEVFEGAEQSVTTGRLAAGGLSFPDHLARASDPSSPWYERLVTEGASRHWVVLQDQSQIPGFPQTQEQWIRSRDAAIGLNDLVADSGAETMFFVTWGRRDGDAMNPSFYPDFTTMQAQLTAGYLTYGAATRTEERPVWYAPVGQAWAKIHDDLVEAGEAPVARDTLFHRLYSDDGSHPSALGTQLTAYVFFSAITGQSPVGLPTPRGLSDEDASALQLAAEAAVFDETDAFSFPWELSGDEDTGSSGSDSGSADPDDGDDVASDDGDGGETPTGDADASSGSKEAEKHESSGCASVQSQPSAWLLSFGLVLVTLRGRRRSDVLSPSASTSAD